MFKVQTKELETCYFSSSGQANLSRLRAAGKVILDQTVFWLSEQIDVGRGLLA